MKPRSAIVSTAAIAALFSVASQAVEVAQNTQPPPAAEKDKKLSDEKNDDKDRDKGNGKKGKPVRDQAGGNGPPQGEAKHGRQKHGDQKHDGERNGQSSGDAKPQKPRIEELPAKTPPPKAETMPPPAKAEPPREPDRRPEQPEAGRGPNVPRPGGSRGAGQEPNGWKEPEPKAPEVKQPGAESSKPLPNGKLASPPVMRPGVPQPGDRKDAGLNKDADRNRDANRSKDAERKEAPRAFPDGPRPGGFERRQWSGGKPPAPPEARNLDDLKTKRRERAEDGGKRVIIEEPDRRRIIREGGRSIIRHDETERFRRIAPETRMERRDGLDISVALLPGGIRIYTELDGEGRPLRRYRRGPDGRDIVLFDNRPYFRRARPGSFLDAIIDLPPPRLTIPRERYIVEYDRASDEEIYDTLDAPPVDEIGHGYSLEEVRRSPSLRDRMRRIDLDTVNFDFGSWTVEYSQYGALERLARAMHRIIDRNPAEMFLIEGHTDAVGSDEDNLSLSDRRAEAVAVILTEEFGVPPENLTTQGYGEQYLKVPTDGPERLNRRVAVRRITPLLAR